MLLIFSGFPGTELFLGPKFFFNFVFEISCLFLILNRIKLFLILNRIKLKSSAA